MACPGRSALAIALGLAITGCRLHVEQVEAGPRLNLSRYDALTPGEHDRGDVLASLGPPDQVLYTLNEEILEYRFGRHKGTDLEFVLALNDPTLSGVTGALRSVVGFLIPRPEPIEFSTEPLAVQAADRGTSQVSPIGGSQALLLQQRRLRFDVVRLELQRSDLKLIRKELLVSVPANSIGDTTRTIFLRGD